MQLCTHARGALLLAAFACGSLGACGDDTERPVGTSGSSGATSGVVTTTSNATSPTSSTTIAVAGTGSTGPAPGDGSGKDARPPGTNPP